MPQPYVHIELDKPRKLRFRHNDLADMEEQHRTSFKELLQRSEFHGARVLLSFGLRWQEKRGMTPHAAGELIQDHWIDKGRTLDELGAVVEDALRAGGFIRDGKAVEESPADGDAGNAEPEAE